MRESPKPTMSRGREVPTTAPFPETRLPQFDSDFQRQVDGFFGAGKKCFADEAGQAAMDEERLENERLADKYYDMGCNLRRLGSDKQLEMIRRDPSVVAEELSVLAGRMVETNPDIGSNYQNLSSNVADQSLQDHQTTKSIFLASGRKLFPEVKPSMHRLDDVFERSRQTLEAIGLKTVGGLDRHLVHSLNDPEGFAKGKPRELLKRLDVFLLDAGENAQSFVLGFVRDGQAEQPDEVKKDLAQLVRVIYQMQLVRDNLHEQIYGRDKSPQEARKLDEIRGRFEGIQTGKNDGSQTAEMSKSQRSELLGSLKAVKTIEDAVEAVTPEVIAALRDLFLEEIDRKIEAAQRFRQDKSAKGRNAILGADTIALVTGWSIGPNCQKIIAARDKKAPNIDAVLGMSPAEFLKDYLDYDLAADGKRAALLRENTNMLG